MPEAEPPTPADLEADLRLIGDAARAAGEIAQRYFRRDPRVWMKGGVSPVSEADYAVDRFLHETLLQARPNYGWLSEETADSLERLKMTRTFVVDPIDGTRAFLEGRDTWCVSIAVVEAGRPLSGVLECPAKKEFYSATVASGATCNGKLLQVLEPGEEIVIAGPKQLIRSAPSRLGSRFREVSYIPSLAYRVAMVASGQLHATFVKPNAHDWDLAAADLILQQAGGAVLDRFGKSVHYAGPNPRHGSLAAGSGDLLSQMVPVLASYES